MTYGANDVPDLVSASSVLGGKIDGTAANGEVKIFPMDWDSSSLADPRINVGIDDSTGGSNVKLRRITNVATPTADSDAATKGYVDGLINTDVINLFSIDTLSATAADGSDMYVVRADTNELIISQRPGTFSISGLSYLRAVLIGDTPIIFFDRTKPTNTMFSWDGGDLPLPTDPSYSGYVHIKGGGSVNRNSVGLNEIITSPFNISFPIISSNPTTFNVQMGISLTPSGIISVDIDCFANCAIVDGTVLGINY